MTRIRRRQPRQLNKAVLLLIPPLLVALFVTLVFRMLLSSPEVKQKNVLQEKAGSGSESSGYCIRNSSLVSCCDPGHCELVRKSTLFSECCDTPATKVWPILITGTPRSGTVFVCEVLQSLGLRVQNDWDDPLADGMVSWMHIFPGIHDNYMGERGRLRGGRFSTVIHLVRDPLKAITSIAFTEPVLAPGYRQFVSHFVPLVRPRSKSMELMAMEFFLKWNEFIESLRVPLIRLEDVSVESVLDVYRLAGLDAPSRIVVEKVLAGKGPVNTRQHRATLTWPELCEVDLELTQQIWKLSQKFGYYLDTAGDPCDAPMSGPT